MKKYYYQLDTYKGVIFFKCDTPLRDREDARIIAGGPVSWMSPISALDYYVNKIAIKLGVDFKEW